MRIFKPAAVAIAVLAVFAAVVDGQERNVTVSGDVTDASGAHVSAAELTVNLKQCKCSDCDNPERCDCCPPQFSLRSDEIGHYSFKVPHGKYAVDAKAGSRTAHVEVDLDEGTTKTLNIQLAD